MEGGGTLTLTEEGPRVRLEAVRPDDGRGLYKAWALGDKGSTLLGTLVPEGEVVRLVRTVSRRSLAQAGCWPVTGGRTVLVYSFPPQGEPSPWRPEPHPERFCRDPLVRESLVGRPGFCGKKQGTSRLLSVPFHPREPFPLPLLFCLARVERREGRLWLVWEFDSGGSPVLPQAGEPPQAEEAPPSPAHSAGGQKGEK